jgi:hypothetical protein
VLVISDDGVSTMFDPDEQGRSGWDVSREALARAGGGGTLVLQLIETWEAWATQKESSWESIKRARDNEGWDVHRVSSWEDVVAFARDFSRRHYAGGMMKPGKARE